LGWESVDLTGSFQGSETTESKILEILSKNPQGLHIDKLCWRTQIPINKMGALILNLEIQGLIKAIPGKKFALVRK
jgi:DNA processing protein